MSHIIRFRIEIDPMGGITQTLYLPPYPFDLDGIEEPRPDESSDTIFEADNLALGDLYTAAGDMTATMGRLVKERRLTIASIVRGPQ
jgi:hypothetical protein